MVTAISKFFPLINLLYCGVLLIAVFGFNLRGDEYNE